MDKFLPWRGKFNKEKHINNCQDQRKKYLFVLSVDGMTGKEDQVLLSTLSQLMAEKMDEPIFHVKGWVNGRIEIAVVRSDSWVICRARSSSPLRNWYPDWDLGPGLVLAHKISHANIISRTPSKTYLFESTPHHICAMRFVQRALHAQQKTPPRQTQGMEPTGTDPDKKFDAKTRTFGKDHRDIGI